MKHHATIKAHGIVIPSIFAAFGAVSAFVTFVACGEIAPAQLVVDSGARDPGSPDNESDADTAIVFDAGTTTSDAGAPPACDRQSIAEDAGQAASSSCHNFQLYPCGLPSGQASELRPSCYFALDDCNAVCPGIVFSCQAYGGWCSDGGIVSGTGPIVVQCNSCAPPGGP